MKLRICNTHVSAGHTLTLESGGDTTLDGAVASGNQVNADIGGNLNIASRQDSSAYDSQQHSAGFGVSIPISGGNLSGSINASHADATGDYASVTEQSGIQAGDGGFQVNVHGNTDLQGAVIASSEQAVQDHRNTLATGSLTHSDIANHDRFDVHSIGVGISMSGQSGSNGSNNQGTRTVGAGLTGTAVGVGSASGHADSTTRSGISGGDITITDEPAQEARTGKDAATTVASIDRDVTTGDTSKTGALAKAWNGQQLLGDVMAQSQITAAFGQLAAKTIGDVADRKRNDAIARGDMAEAAKWDEGGEYRVALHAAAGALAGGVQGAAGAATSAAVMPTLGKLIDDLDAPQAVKQALAQVGAAALGGAVGGAAGLASAVNVEANNRQLDSNEYQKAKQYAKIVAQKLGISEQEAEGRIVAEMLRNADQQTAQASGGIHDYQVRSIIGCQNLNCNGSSNDPLYADHNANAQFIAPNQEAYHLGQTQAGTEQTYNQLVKNNIQKSPGKRYGQ